MALSSLSTNDLLAKTFEPRLKSRYVVLVGEIPSYMVKSMGAISFNDGEIKIDHINNYFKVKGGQRVWENITLGLYDPITPSGAQMIMKWATIAYNNLTGQAGYADMYKQDLVFRGISNDGSIVNEWILKGAFIVSANFGNWAFADHTNAQELSLTLAFDDALINF